MVVYKFCSSKSLNMVEQLRVPKYKKNKFLHLPFTNLNVHYINDDL